MNRQDFMGKIKEFQKWRDQVTALGLLPPDFSTLIELDKTLDADIEKKQALYEHLASEVIKLGVERDRIQKEITQLASKHQESLRLDQEILSKKTVRDSLDKEVEELRNQREKEKEFQDELQRVMSKHKN